MLKQKNRLIEHLLLLLLITLTFSCHKKTVSAVTKTENEMQALNYVSAKVVLQTELAGCGYMLALSDGKMLQPLNLNDTLKHDGLKLWVNYQIEKNAMSVCMMGQPVKINDAKRIKK